MNISGPLTSEGLELSTLHLFTNETHPAVVRCQVTCHNYLGFYNPVMGLIITSEEPARLRRIPAVNISSGDGLYEILFNLISMCEAHNNHTMKFEYLIYSNNSNIDGAVLQCGVFVRHSPIANPPELCWGQTHGIIRYDTKTITITLPTTKSQTTRTDMIMHSSLTPMFKCVNGTRLDNDTGNCTGMIY